VQQRVGVREQLERAGRSMIKDSLPEPLRDWLAALPFLLVGSIDSEGRVWASVLAGEPGFIRAPSPRLLTIHAQPAAGDPLAHQLGPGAPLGLLGMQLETRRRYRVNGRIASRDDTSFSLAVEQSFGNCKQYIQAREPHYDPALLGRARPALVEGPSLSTRASELLAHTDTFFIATASAAAVEGGDGQGGDGDGEGVDVSHRGGRPGFVRVAPSPTGTRLTVPDFRGNFVFNTFGNLEVNPHAGLACIDFDTGDTLLLTGLARATWDGPELASFEGADRLLTFDVTAGVLLPGALPIQFRGYSPSPDLLETGTWDEAARQAEPT